jgi:hypothetical protein
MNHAKPMIDWGNAGERAYSRETRTPGTTTTETISARYVPGAPGVAEGWAVIEFSSAVQYGGGAQHSVSGSVTLAPHDARALAAAIWPTPQAPASPPLLAQACIECGIPDSKYEALCIATQSGEPIRPVATVKRSEMGVSVDLHDRTLPAGTNLYSQAQPTPVPAAEALTDALEDIKDAENAPIWADIHPELERTVNKVFKFVKSLAAPVPAAEASQQPDQAHGMPPFAAPASQHDASDVERFWNKAIEAEAEASRLKSENQDLRAALRAISENPMRCVAIADAALNNE